MEDISADAAGGEGLDEGLALPPQVRGEPSMFPSTEVDGGEGFDEGLALPQVRGEPIMLPSMPHAFSADVERAGDGGRARGISIWGEAPAFGFGTLGGSAVVCEGSLNEDHWAVWPGFGETRVGVGILGTGSVGAERSRAAGRPSTIAVGPGPVPAILRPHLEEHTCLVAALKDAGLN
jgi:hypothetical protein